MLLGGEVVNSVHSSGVAQQVATATAVGVKRDVSQLTSSHHMQSVLCV